MKWFISVFIFLLLTSCFFPTGAYQFTSLEEACLWIDDNIEYATDYDVWGIAEYWQAPEQTLSLMTGDCEDCAVLMMDVADSMGYEPWCVVVKFETGAYHAVCEIGDIIYDATAGYVAGYDDYMKYMEAYETNRHSLATIKMVIGNKGA